MENLVTEVTGSAERHPGGTLPLAPDVQANLMLIKPDLCSTYYTTSRVYTYSYSCRAISAPYLFNLGTFFRGNSSFLHELGILCIYVRTRLPDILMQDIKLYYA